MSVLLKFTPWTIYKNSTSSCSGCGYSEARHSASNGDWRGDVALHIHFSVRACVLQLLGGLAYLSSSLTTGLSEVKYPRIFLTSRLKGPSWTRPLGVPSCFQRDIIKPISSINDGFRAPPAPPQSFENFRPCVRGALSDSLVYRSSSLVNVTLTAW